MDFNFDKLPTDKILLKDFIIINSQFVNLVINSVPCSGVNIKFGVFVIESSLILSAIPMNAFGWIFLSWFKLKTSIWSKSISGMDFIEQFEMSNIPKCFSLDDLFNHLAKQGLYLTLK